MIAGVSQDLNQSTMEIGLDDREDSKMISYGLVNIPKKDVASAVARSRRSEHTPLF